MTSPDKQQQLKQTVEALIDAGCNYRLHELERLYSADLQIVMVQENGEIASFDYGQNMDFFRRLRDSGARPIDATTSFNYVGFQGDEGYVVVTRHMDLGAGPRKIVFNLMLKHSVDRWRVFREHAVVVGAAGKSSAS